MKNLIVLAVLFLCFSFLAKAQVSVEDGASSQSFQAKIQLFPNPATEYLHVKFESQNVADLQLSVRNIIGNEIKAEVEFLAENELRLRVKDFTIGYYLIAFRDEKTNFRGTYKFLKR